MSPEQCAGKSADERSDIYSLGCVIYEALTGAPPFHADSALGLIREHQTKSAPSLKEASMGRDYPEPLEKAISKALEKNPGARFQSFINLADSLLSIKHSKSKTPTALGSIQKDFSSASKNDSELFNWKPIVVIVLSNICSIALTCFLMTNFLHQETNRITLQSDVHDYVSDLTTSRTMFMSVTGNGANQKRVFHFPALSLGKFGYFNSQTMQWVDFNAQGHVVIPLNVQTKFETEDRIIIEREKALRLFGPNDITNLIINPTKVGRYEDHLAPMIDSSMAYVSRFKSLTQLSLRQLPVTDVGVRCLQDLPNLIAIDLSHSKASMEEIRKLKNYKILTSLRIGGILGAKEVIKDLLRNPNIKVLGLSNSDLDDADIETLSKLSLHSLDLSGNAKISDIGLCALSKNTQMINLDLSGTSITPQSNAHLAKFKNLRAIFLPVNGWKKADMETLSRLLPECQLVAMMPLPSGNGYQVIDWKKMLP